MASLGGSGLAVHSVPSVEAEDLPEAISGSGTLGIIGGLALSTPLPQRTPPPPSFSSLGPPFLPLPAGQGPTVASGLGEGKREGVGGGPSSRECNSPRPQNSSWTQARGPAWDTALRVGRLGLFLPPVSLAGHYPSPDTLLCSLTLESPTHPIPTLILSPSFVNTGL